MASRRFGVNGSPQIAHGCLGILGTGGKEHSFSIKLPEPKASQKRAPRLEVALQ
jgi:hypothetical protein